MHSLSIRTELLPFIVMKSVKSSTPNHMMLLLDRVLPFNTCGLLTVYMQLPELVDHHSPQWPFVHSHRLLMLIFQVFPLAVLNALPGLQHARKRR